MEQLYGDSEFYPGGSGVGSTCCAEKAYAGLELPVGDAEEMHVGDVTDEIMSRRKCMRSLMEWRKVRGFGA